MNLNELAATRRSVRVYKEAGLSEEESLKKIKEIVDFVRINSPSWKNSQTHRYYAAVSAEKIAQVRDALSLRNQEKVNNSIALVVTAFEKTFPVLQKASRIMNLETVGVHTTWD